MSAQYMYTPNVKMAYSVHVSISFECILEDRTKKHPSIWPRNQTGSWQLSTEAYINTCAIGTILLTRSYVSIRATGMTNCATLKTQGRVSHFDTLQKLWFLVADVFVHKINKQISLRCYVLIHVDTSTISMHASKHYPGLNVFE